MDPLVSAQWLAERLDDPPLRLFDATVQVARRLFVPTVRTGEREWRQGHIPGVPSPTSSRCPTPRGQDGR
jgi:thiosulfate/3-mercaptopyruvate sulfurtransferase